jgi:hypothetical protein
VIVLPVRLLLKTMWSWSVASLSAFAALIASRRVQSQLVAELQLPPRPVSAVLPTVKVSTRPGHSA